MRNIVNFETAVRLKGAGFPQPEIAQKGQFWYDQKGSVQIIYFDPILPDEFCEQFKAKGWVYAPDATDILEQLGQMFVLFYDECPKIKDWFCAKTSDVFGEIQVPLGHKNPAEAAALAWLEVNEKKETETE